MREYAQEGSYERREALTRAHSMCFVCVCEREIEGDRECVHVRGEAEQGCQRCVKLNCQMSEGSVKSAAPSRATGCQDAYHALFRCLSLVPAD